MGLSAEEAAVPPHVGGWIEIEAHNHDRHCAESRPMWAGGLKFPNPKQLIPHCAVPPHVGGWIFHGVRNLVEGD